MSVGCLAFAGVANASVQQGDTELDALGGWISQDGEDSDSDFDSFFVSAAMGYFITDNIQVGPAVIGAWTEIGDLDVDIWAVGAKAKYHFMPTNQWVPYVGGQILFADVDYDVADGDGTLWGPVAGLRYELNAYNDFFVEFQYHLWEGDIGDVIDDGMGLFVGLVHQFK